MKKILIIEARFYNDISNMLLEGALEEIKQNGYHYQIVNVLGAFEIPAAIAFAAQNGHYDGYLALGCVIRGETSHYDYVCLESARGLNDLACRKMLAIGYGIITVENKKQAIVRADIKQKNKGGFAAKACINMIKIKDQFKPQ